MESRTGKSRLSFVHRQNNGYRRPDIGNENSNQQANKPPEVAIDSIFDVCKTVVHVVQSAVDAVQSVADLLNDRFKGGDSAFNGTNVHNSPFACALSGECVNGAGSNQCFVRVSPI